LNFLALALFLVLAGLLWSVPRKWALAPFLAGCCLITLGQGIELGPVNLQIFRMLILVGFSRVVVRGESVVGGLNAVDKVLIGWALWYFLASWFHDNNLDAGPIYVSGVIFNILGFYFLARTWVSSLEDTVGLILFAALLLVPVALEMLFEKATGRNLFSYFGGVSEVVLVRDGRLRASGPFIHPILAGTVGATCLPWFVGILREHRWIAFTGMTAACVMVFASASSGPIMSLMFAAFALGMWKFKHLTGLFRRGAVVTYIVLMFVMSRPPYYLISKIDLSGGSTGWHRSFLIDSTIQHFNEWWLFGTDYTRHWMPMQGTAMSPTHTDITNYYIGFGVGGGFPAMMLILTAVVMALFWVGRVHDTLIDETPEYAFMIWCFGAALFSHLCTGISVAYFDQSLVFYWLNVAVISSMYSLRVIRADEFGESKVLQ
jgi:hypothetical protein